MILVSAAAARITGRHQRTPFFDAEGRRVGRKVEVTNEMRACGFGSTA